MIRYVFFLLLFTSCVTQERCLEKFPPQPLTKLIELHDTTIMTRDSILVDTLALTKYDTVLIKNRLFIRPKLFHNKDISTNWINDSLMVIKAHCRGDTIRLKGIHTTQTITNVVEKVVDKVPFKIWIIIGLLVLVILILIFK